MSSNGSNNVQDNRNRQLTPQQSLALQQKHLMELGYKFKELIAEAKQVGPNTPRGKEILAQATKLKQVYDKFHRQRQQAVQSFAKAQAQAQAQGQVPPVQTQSQSSNQSPSSGPNSFQPTPFDQNQVNVSNNNATTNSNNNMANDALNASINGQSPGIVGTPVNVNSAQLSNNVASQDIKGTPSTNSPQVNIPNSTPSSSSSMTSNMSKQSAQQNLSNYIKQVLTPEQTKQHDQLVHSFQIKVTSLKEKHNLIKQHIEKFTAEINKPDIDPNHKQTLEKRRDDLVQNIKNLNLQYNSIYQTFQNSKKSFYIAAARQNPALQKLLQRGSQQRFASQQQQQQQQQQQIQQQQQQQIQQQTQAQAQKSQKMPQSLQYDEKNAVQPQSSNATPVHEPSPITNTNDTNNNTNVNNVSTPQSNMQVKTPAQNVIPSQQQNIPEQQQIMQQQQTSSKSQSQQQPPTVTKVNAAASLTSKSINKNINIFKQTEPLLPVSEHITTKIPEAIPYRSNRPTLTGGTAMNASVLNTPAQTKLPPYEIDTQRVMLKRKLKEVVRSVGVDDGDGETVIDGDVEELLLDMADDFVTNITSFACRVAKHRKSDNLEASDLQLHLEKNWNIRIPGYSMDLTRNLKRWNPTPAYNQKVNALHPTKGSSKHSHAGINKVSSSKIR